MSRSQRVHWLVTIAPAMTVAVVAALTGAHSVWMVGVLFLIAGIVAMVAHRRGQPPSAPIEPSTMRSSVEPSPAPVGEQKLFESILGSMFDGVMVVDGEHRLLYVNRSARELLDLGERAVEGRLFSEVSRSSPLEEIIEKALKRDEQQDAELMLARQKLTLAVSAGRLSLAHNRGVLLVLHDVTELRRLERMRRDFVSNVSHELKTPLTSIQAYADTLLEGGLTDVEHNRMFVERILEQTERLQGLILDLLSLARIESDETALEIDQVDLAEEIQACVADRLAIATAKHVSLIVENMESPLLVEAEGEGLRTILDNLVDNAINYTPAQGAVTIKASRSGGEVCLSVIDTGVGIPREHQDRVFERFYRVDRARSRELGGTGLGLSIVKHLAHAFGGRVELESELNRGSHFMVWLRASTSLPDRISADGPKPG